MINYRIVFMLDNSYIRNGCYVTMYWRISLFQALSRDNSNLEQIKILIVVVVILMHSDSNVTAINLL